MSLPQDLLEQSRFLVERDSTRPRQANLRRGVSSAYYALFHLLSTDAAERMIPLGNSALVDQIRRSFQHGEMKDACREFAKSQPHSDIWNLLGAPPSVNLRAVANAFVVLQEARHHADYDLSSRVSRATALSRIEDAELAFTNWKAIRRSNEATVFTAALAFRKRWSRQ